MTSAAQIRSPARIQPGKSEARPRRFFAAADTDERHRRPADWIVFGVAAAGVLLLAERAGHEGPLETTLTQALAEAPAWLHDVVAGLYKFASLSTAAVLVGGVLLARRWRLARDLALAAALAWILGRLLALLVAGPGVGDLFSGADVGTFPLVRVALVTALLVTASPFLTRPARHVGWSVIVLTGAMAALLPAGFPADILGGFLLGLAVGAGLHLLFGSPSGRPSLAQVVLALAELGVTAGTPARSLPVDGAVLVEWAEGDGLVAATALGRDAADAQLLARLWRFLWYKEGAGRLLSSRNDRVGNEALVALLAERAGAATPRLLAVGVADDDLAVIAVTQPDGSTLADLAGLQVGTEADADELLARTWSEVAILHATGITHGALNLSHVVVGRDSRPTIIGLANAGYDSSAAQRSRDVAELLVSTAVVVGPARAVAAARRGIGPEAVAASLPYVQPPVLTSATRDAVHRRDKAAGDKLLPALRQVAAEATGGTLPELEEVRRVKVQNVILIAATFVGASIIISQLGGIEGVLDELKSAELAWVVAAFVVSLLPPIAEAVALNGAVDTPVRMGPASVLQYAQKFTNLVMPGLLGTGAMTARFLSTQGVSLNDAVVSGGVVSMAGTFVQVTLFVLAVTVFDAQIDLGSAGSGGSGDTGRVIVIAVIVIGLLGGLIWRIPRLHKRVMPQLGKAWASVRRLVTDPRRMAMVLGGNLTSQVVYAIVLGLSLQAYGEHLNLGTLLVVNTVATLFASFIPVPGGMGIAEAALTGGLTAAGIPPATAAAAAVTHRLVTFYVPPLYGWVAMRWLTKRGYV